MSRDVEVLRDLLTSIRIESGQVSGQTLADVLAQMEALPRAILALEEKEAREPEHVQAAKAAREALGLPPTAAETALEARERELGGYMERLRVVAAGARALALATTDAAAKVELERLATLAEEGGR